MGKLAEGLYAFVITLWVGALWAIGYIAAPTLFSALSDRTLAGDLAGRLFTVVAWVGMVSGAYLLLFLGFRNGWSVFRSAVFWVALAMVLLTLAGHFGVQPILAKLKAEAFPREVMESVVKSRFAAWHGISSVLYLVQSLFGLALVLLQSRGRR